MDGREDVHELALECAGMCGMLHVMLHVMLRVVLRVMLRVVLRAMLHVMLCGMLRVMLRIVLDVVCVCRYCGLRKRRKVQACWKARETISTIIVHKDMLLDHTPHRMLSILQRFQQHPDVTPPPPRVESDGDHLRQRVFTA